MARLVAFRDYMRTHPELVAEYAERKRQLAVERGADPDQRDGYRAGKANFIRAVTDEALTEVTPHGEHSHAQENRQATPPERLRRPAGGQGSAV